MAIRFQCAACDQPIEVDDDLAARVVGCPYCHKTVTAPGRSTLAHPDDVPVATPLGSADSLSYPTALPTQSEITPKGNTLAVVAFAFACLLILLQLVIAGIWARHGLEYEDFMKQIESAGPEFSTKLAAMNEYVSDRGGTLPAWMVLFSLLQLGALGACVASIVCSIIALRRPLRRGIAMAALAISGGFVLLAFLNVTLF